MKPSAYLALFLGLSLPAMACAYAAIRTLAIESACDARGYSDDAYMANCPDSAFGDYEHAAYLRRLEPAAVAAARRAEVLFLGNSRLQVAFSRPATTAFFAPRHATFHLMGFGYGGMAPFAFQVFNALDLRPRVLIVNVDPFFEPVWSPPASLLIRGSWKTRVDDALKSAAQPLHRFLCDRDPSPCPAGLRAVFRSRETGEWIWDEARASDTSVRFEPPAPSLDAAAIRADAALAETFLGASGVAPGCVILTQVPEPFADHAPLVAEIARRTGAVGVLPRLSGLATFDGSHLDRPSGDAWAEAFFAEAAPAIDRCLARPVQEAAP